MPSNSIVRKFVDVISLKNWQVLSEHNTWNDIVSINKTIPYEEWTVVFSDDTELTCADNHILITSKGQEVYAKCAGGHTFLNRYGRLLFVKGMYPSHVEVNMYDLSLAENTNHLYYTNGILSHNSTTYCMFLLWYLIFNPEKKVLIAANKKSTSLDILSKISLAYEMLPNWIKPGLLEYNKGKMKFGNLSEIVAEATSSDAARGTSCNILVLDEFAFAEQAEKFWASVYPIISSDINGKVIIVSTPNGTGNLFETLWNKANTNGPDNDEGWKPVKVEWWEVPGRDERWKQQQIASLGSIAAFSQEFGNQFLSSTWKKLISDEMIMKFRQMLVHDNIKGEILSVDENDKDCKFTFTQYHKFDPRRTYIAGADSAEGTQGDASVLYVFDITNFSNIKMCAKFSQNNVSTTEFAYIIFNVLKKYYNPYLAVERNTTGGAVLDALCETVYNYENVIIMNKHNKPGIMSHMQIKQKACLWIRELFAIEEFNIHLYDNKVIDEMNTFIKKDTAQHIVYGAMVKKHDDHLMCLIWALYILTQELLQQYYNVIEWETTNIGKAIPKVIGPLQPYEMEQNVFDKLVEEAAEDKDLYIPNKLVEATNIKQRDRFFGDIDDETDEGIFTGAKSVEDIEETMREAMLYRNMIG